MPLLTHFYESPLGPLQLTARDEVLVAVLFANSQKNPAPNREATLETSGVLQACAEQLTAYFAGNLSQFDLPFAHEGSEFRKRVWQALEGIPYGQTISYLELSRRIGNEKAIRAVGTTNGANQISLIVPCHRVIGSNGSLVGYSGDLWRKQWLLDHERRNAPQGQLSLF